jgi:hypothetical protein
MWILLILVIGYHDNSSQLAAEFHSREACMNAAQIWTQQASTSSRHNAGVTVRTACAYKGDKPKEGK